MYLLPLNRRSLDVIDVASGQKRRAIEFDMPAEDAILCFSVNPAGTRVLLTTGGDRNDIWLAEGFALTGKPDRSGPPLPRDDMTGTGAETGKGGQKVIQRRQHFRFALKMANAIRVARELLRQDLDRNFTLQLQIASAIDLAHAAFSEQRRYLV